MSGEDGELQGDLPKNRLQARHRLFQQGASSASHSASSLKLWMLFSEGFLVTLITCY